MSITLKRIITGIFIFLCIFWAPWWVTILIASAGVFVFNNYIEFIFTGLIMYSIYGVGSMGILGSTLYLPVILVGIYLIFSFIKKYIIIYNK